MKPIEEIVAEAKVRQDAAGPLLAQMREVRNIYNGDFVMPFVDLGASAHASVPNLLQQGLDQMGARIASTTPDLYYPPTLPGQRKAEQQANLRRKANLGWWNDNRIGIKLRRRARHLVGYACSPVVIRPDAQRKTVLWEVRDPMGCFPAPTGDPDVLVPPDVIFSYIRSLSWLRQQYPDAMRSLYKGEEPRADDQYDILEYRDDQETVLVVVGKHKPYWLTDSEASQLGASACELVRYPTLIGMPSSVVPGRVTLDRPQGQFHGMIGMYQTSAQMMALQVMAAGKAVFPDLAIESRQNEQGDLESGVWHDGRTGLINIIKGGTLREVQLSPGFATLPTIRELERSQRLTAGVPAEFGGECADEATEILTATGWKHYGEVAVGDEVLTLNHETGAAEWQPIQAMNVYPASPGRPMIEMDGPRFSALTTLNHRWPVVSPSGVRKWKNSPDLTGGDKIPTAAVNADLPTEAKFSDALVESVAWFYTEGSFEGSKGQISQSLTRNPENVERIRNCLTGTFGPATGRWRDLSGGGRGGVGHDGVPRWCEQKIASNGVIKFSLSAHASRLLQEYAPNKVPTFEFLRALTAAQLELFLRVSMLADNCGPDRFGQKDPARSEAFAFAAILAGRPVSYQTRVKTDSRPGWPPVSTAHLVRVKKRRFAKPMENAQRGASTLREVYYDGVVWCPTTANQSWFARRNGFAYFTGNSPTNVRTGKRGDAVMGALVDFPVQEAQEVLAASMQEENRIAVATMKAFFGDQTKSIYVNWKGASGHIEYTPNDVFVTDNNIVTFPHGGADANALVISGGQRVGQGTLSKRSFMELDPLVSDPEQEHDRIVAEGLELAFLSSLQQAAAQPDGIPLPDLARIAELVLQDKKELYEAVQTVHEEAQQRQAPDVNPVSPGAPEAQPGITPPGAGAEAGTAIPQVAPSLDHLSQLMQSLRGPMRGIPPAGRPTAG